MLGLGWVIAAFFVQPAGAAPVQPVVSCDEIETGRMYVRSTAVPEYYKLKLPANLNLLPGEFKGIEARDQADQPAPDMAASLTARVERAMPFYEEVKVLPPSRGNAQPGQEQRRVFAVSVLLKSTTYDLEWYEGGDYRYPVKELRRNVFCTLIAR